MRVYCSMDTLLIHSLVHSFTQLYTFGKKYYILRNYNIQRKRNVMWTLLIHSFLLLLGKKKMIVMALRSTWHE